MNAERLQQIESLYHAARELEEGQQAAFLREACGADDVLCREVESLLACSAQAERFIELPAVQLAARALARDEVRFSLAGETAEIRISGTGDKPARWVPANIGCYRTIRVLGEGGMGVVYEAEQEHPRRIVALKVIKPGLATPELLWRFEQESQALARLQHPGIAQIYQAGTADSGFGPQPYFAMELIRGESLLQYAEAHQLNTRQRLELMAKVCEAVHHAHQRGIIHRDLKPGNILVDESGQPKILDLGVARLTDSDVQATRLTDVGQIVGTLAYMSPEQVLADPLELDTRSDVYALGVILFELLAGQLPYTISRHLHEAVKTIREQDPAPLSSIRRVYRGDIETIVTKALEKDKGRRYASAAGMAGDIRRYLNDEPIIARPATAAYQLRKFASRHKALVSGVGAVFVVLIAGIITSTLEATRARRAEQAATTESATAKAVNDFLQSDLLAQASASNQARPDTRPDPDLKVRTALDRAAATIAGKFREQPLVEASIQQTIGNTYRDLGLYAEAQRHVERALELRRRAIGEEHSETLSSMQKLALLYDDEGKYGQAEPLYTRVLDIRRRVLGEQNPDTLDAMSDLALLYTDEGKHAQAEALFTRALEVKRRVLGVDHPETLVTMNNLAGLYDMEGKYAQAEPLFTTVLEIRQRVLGKEHPNTLNTMNNLALVYRDEGKYARAEALYIQVLEVWRRVLGADHPDTLIGMNNLAELYSDERKYTLAEPLFIEVLDSRRNDAQPERSNAMNNLGVLYRSQGKYLQAEPLFTHALERQRRMLGDEHPDTLNTMNNLALLYQYQHRYSRAEPLLREMLEKHPRIISVSWHGYNCQSLLGASLSGQKKYAEAEPLLLSGFEGMLQQEAAIPASNRFKLQEAGEWIVQLYQHWGKPEKAAVWVQRLQTANLSASPGKP
jgi:serine/threonine protein kinase/Tfp pilus assembly protein PilF